MPTIEELHQELTKSNRTITETYEGLATKLAEQRKELDALKARGESPETPPHIAKAIETLEKSLDANKLAVGEIQKELTERVLRQLESAQGQLDELQKAGQRGGILGGAPEVTKSVGEQVVELVKANEGLFQSGQKLRGVPQLVLKGTLGSHPMMRPTDQEVAKALTTGATPNFVPVMQRPDILPMMQRRLRMRDLLTWDPTDRLTIRYLRETGFTTVSTTAISSITRSSSTVTVTQNGHGYRTFDLIKIAGATQTEYNGNWRIKVVDANTYTFTIATTPATPATGSPVARRMNNFGAAAFVGENAQKPEGDMFFEEKDMSVRVIAHYVTATNQVLDDLPGLRRRIDSSLFYGLERRVDDAILYGSGTGDQIQGLMTLAGTQSYLWSQGLTNDTETDAIRRAMTLVELADYEASGVVIHPSIWEKIETSKGSDKHYLWVDNMGTGAASERLWRMPLIVTQAIEASKFALGSYSMGARGYDRQQPNVRFADQADDDFTKNRVKILAEQRLGIAWERPEAFVIGTFDSAPA